MAANGNLIFQDTNKATFVGANSNVVIDTVHASFGVGVDVNGPTSNLHVVGNAYVTSNLEVGTANLFVDTVNSRVGVGTTSPQQKLDLGDLGGGSIRLGRDHDDDNTSTNRIGRSGVGNDVWYSSVNFIDEDTNDDAISFVTHRSGVGQFERMRISGNGNVGIGTSTPRTNLHIGQQLNSQGDKNTIPSAGLGISANFPSTTHAWFSNRVNATGDEYWGLAVGTIYDGASYLQNLNKNTVTYYNLLLQPNGGNVGIGTTSPIGKLDVRGAIMTPVISYSSNQDAPYLIAGTSGYTGAATNWNTHGIQHRIKTSSGGVPRITVDTPSGGEVFSIVNDGNVGIGKTDPGAKLDVNGSIRGAYNTNTTSYFGRSAVGYVGHNDWAGFAHIDRNSLDDYALLQNSAGRTILNSKSDQRISFSSGDQETMCVKGSDVGIGTSGPGAKLHVNGPEIRVTNVDTAVAQISAYGSSQGTGRLYVGQSNQYGGGIEYNGDNSPASTGAGADYTTLYRVQASSYYWTARNVYNSNQWEFRTAIDNTSDDRVKENETYIRGATDTLMKIKPQLYDKKPSIESTDTKEWLCESGLIAQELYYDVPELRHLVKIPRDARDIDANISVTSADPTVDPDYSAWGKDTSAVNYVGLIPYLIKSVQEITTELPRHKTPVSNITPQNVEDFVGMIVSKRGSVELSTKSEDKACYGVISEINCDTQNNEVLVNSCGEGKIWITNLTGNVEAGDLITTSNIAGYGQLQNSAVLSNFTVAKLIEDCDFNPPSTPVRRIRQEMSNVIVYSVTREVRVTEEEYNELAEEDRTTENRITYFDGDNQIDLDTYSNLESNTLRTETTLVFKLIHRHTSRTMREGYTPEVRQELVNVLDEHGQLVWEDHPTETEKAYKIRYLDANGVITDEANAVHTAAFVGCTYHCG